MKTKYLLAIIAAAVAGFYFSPFLQADPVGDALDVTNLTFTTGGDAPWFVENTNTHAGATALQSGSLGDNQSSWLRTTVSGPGTLTYWYAISTEIDHDNFFLPWVGYTSGGADYLWQQETLNIPAGIYDLEWLYEKDASGSDGSDACWLDQFVWEPAGNPRVTVSPQWKYPGETCSFSASVSGVGPFSYQWYHENEPIDGATEPDLIPFTATYANAGTYSVAVTNAAGPSMAEAKLVVAPVFYEITDLGSLWSGDFSMSANGVNNHGDVAGTCSANATGIGHAWVWSGGVLTDLGDALGGGDSAAYAINDQGDIVGSARVAGTTNYNAICWRKAASGYEVEDLGRNGWPFAFAPAINNAGDIVFSMSDEGKGGSGNRRGFLWRKGNLLPLGSLLPAWLADTGDAYGWGINGVGQVVGTANVAVGENVLKRGWRFNGAWRENIHDTHRIDALPGVTESIDSSGVYCVNDYGDMLGIYMHSEYGAFGSFITSGTDAYKLTDWWSSPHGLNNHGDMLITTGGLSLFCSTNPAAPARLANGRPRYDDHALFLVADLVAGGLGTFTSLGASGGTYNQLSESRFIVGTGATTDGASHGYLARPLPRPGNSAPVQSAFLMVTNYANTLVIPIDKVLATCTDADGDILALAAAPGRSGDGGTIRRSGNYLIYSTREGIYTDPDSIQCIVMDHHGGQTEATVLVRNRPTDMRPPFEGLRLVNDLGSQPYVRFWATPGETWHLEASDTLAPGSWTTLVSFIVGPDWTVDFVDAAGLEAPKRFYRAVSP